MKREINRYYLEIYSSADLRETKNLNSDYNVLLINPPDFQLNKFFYKNIGKNHHWIDRLIWTENKWKNYVEDSNVETYILKKQNELVGYFELIYHKEIRETEIAYLGLLKEHINQKLGSLLLSSAIKKSFLKNSRRVWVHTCSLDHKNALNNYLSRGMKVFKEEIVSI